MINVGWSVVYVQMRGIRPSANQCLNRSFCRMCKIVVGKTPRRGWVHRIAEKLWHLVSFRWAIGKEGQGRSNQGTGPLMKIKGSRQPRKGPAENGLRWWVERDLQLVLISVVGGTLWQIFCLVEMPPWTCSQGGVSLMTLETPKHAQERKAKLKANELKPAKPTPPPKGAGESSRSILGKEDWDQGIQEQCRQAMHQLDAIFAAPSPVKPPSSKPEARGGIGAFSGIGSCPPIPVSPNYLQMAMVQCGLRLNEEGEPIPTNMESPYRFPPATIGFQALKAMPVGLDQGVAEEIHFTLVAWLQGETGETGSPAALVAATFSLCPSQGVGFCSPSPPTTLVKPSTSLRALESNLPSTSTLAFCIWESVVLHVMYECWCYAHGSNFVTDPEGKMHCLANSILQLKGWVQTKQERQLEQMGDKIFDLVGQIMALVQTTKHKA